MPKTRCKRGVSIIPILFLTSLLSILVLMYFADARRAIDDANQDSAGKIADSAADTATNLVIAQLQKATTQVSTAWASQPGVIRTWDDSGRFKMGYKLYSDETMIEPNQKVLVEADFQELANWARDPAIYVDLNEPIIRGEKAHYPIVDPAARDLPVWKEETEHDGAGVEGFDYTLENIQRGQMSDKLAALEAEPLPMPAKWIYQLKDGSFGVLDRQKKFVPAIEDGATPSRDNPIVVRFAFWTDDETCKLNPNVHAGGTGWTTPKAGGDYDRHLNSFLPAKNEWQRYPGHPATTHLSPVLFPGPYSIVSAQSGYQWHKNRIEALETIYRLVPRIVGGGSQQGTRSVNFLKPEEENGLVPDKDRLYASVDDLLLRPDRKPNQFPDPHRPQDMLPTDQVAEQLEMSRFFLSVTSQAPETTLFNTPRVSMWPTHYHAGNQSSNRHTPHDRLLRFCAELGGIPNRHSYHFQRKNADSKTADFTEIHRNRELYAYLDRLTSLRTPGYGKSFAAKYADEERLQILTEIFDYIRSSNLHDDNVYGENWRDAFTEDVVNSANHLTFTNGRIKPDPGEIPPHWASARDSGFLNPIALTETPEYWQAAPRIHKGHGQVTPISINHHGFQTKGLGRFYTIQDVAIHVIACADGGDGTGGGGWQPADPGTIQYRRGEIEAPSDQRFSNFPPLPERVVKSDKESWPEWLTLLEEKSPELIDHAFDPENWNWQLAWLDPAYEHAMPGTKFERSNLIDGSITRLGPGEKLVQAALIWSMFSPSLGWTPINPDMIVDFQIDGMDLIDAEGNPIQIGWKIKPRFGGSGPGATSWGTSRNGFASDDYQIGGLKPPNFFRSAGRALAGGRSFQFADQESGAVAGLSIDGRMTPLDRGFTNVRHYHRYHYVTRPFKVLNTVRMNNGTVTARIFTPGGQTGTGEAGGPGGDLTESTTSQSHYPQLVQTLEIPFPSFKVPPPDLAPGRPSYINEIDQEERGKLGPMQYWSLSWEGANPLQASLGRMAISDRDQADHFSEADVVQAVGIGHADARMVAAKSSVDASDKIFLPHRHYGSRQMAHSFAGLVLRPFAGCDNTASAQLVSGVKYHRDKSFVIPTADSAEVQCFGDFDSGLGKAIDGPYINKPEEGNRHFIVNRSFVHPRVFDLEPGNLYHSLGREGTWRGVPSTPYFTFGSYWGIRRGDTDRVIPAYQTPNRFVSSPVMLGSLPVGSSDSQPWRTLLFRPNVTGHKYKSHPGAGNTKQVPDHLLLDLFWMPMVEPYAISETFSTKGKVNLNYQILPFRHIHRNTALRGCLKSETILCIPNKQVYASKVGYGRGIGYHWRDRPYGGSLQKKSLRAVIVEDETLKQFDRRFNDPDDPTIFRSASELCEIHLIPEEQIKHALGHEPAPRNRIDTYQPTIEEMANGKYWSDHAAVGDNARERPYANLYAKVTTKSNTYKVHFRAQALQQGRRNRSKGEEDDAENYTAWDPDLDQSLGEYRGSAIIERYLEPNDPRIPDYATTPQAPPLGEFYRYRIIHRSRFAP